MNTNAVVEAINALAGLALTVAACYAAGCTIVRCAEDWRFVSDLQRADKSADEAMQQRMAARLDEYAQRDMDARIVRRLGAYVGYKPVTKVLDYRLDDGYVQVRSLNEVNDSTLPYEVRVQDREHRKAA
jgi:hypothetical protein